MLKLLRLTLHIQGDMCKLEGSMRGLPISTGQISELSKSTVSIFGILIPNQNIKFKIILKGNRKQEESLLFKTRTDAILKGLVR